MTIQEVIVHAERSEKVLAVQHVPGDEHRTAIIAGWLNASVSVVEDVIPNGHWALKRDDGQIYIVTNDQFKQDFRVMLDAAAHKE